MSAPTYPFSAVVGHDRLLLALLLCAVRPEIGGVLIRGEKGTAKSTAVRGLAQVLSGVDGGALVELPIGATEDRVVGSLDLQKVLRDGEHAFSPGLLARAHGGVLYVDEVNLLHDHLVDVLLDAAAMGRVHVERDGISHSHEARFILIGTMNPEEGELRPQLLDRFGLTVDVAASRDVDVRVEVIRQRMAYEADPVGFADRYAGSDAELARRVSTARALVNSVVLPDNELRRIAALCAAFDVDGMRADLVVARTAVAHAAWRGAAAGASEATGKITVGEEDIRVAAELALPHRRRRDPFDDPGLDPQRLDEAMAEAGQSVDGEPVDGHDEPDPEPDPPGGGADEPSGGEASNSAAGQRTSPPQTAPAAAPSATFRTRALTVPGVGEGAPGRRSRARNRTGTVVSATAEADGHGLHVFGTLLAAAGNQRVAGRPRPGPQDVRRAVRQGREGNLVVFVVDASGSMAARDRMAAVGGATLSLLRDAYQRRDKVAVITFRQRQATLLLPPTSSVYIASRRLSRFDTGGKTPIAEGLLAARDVVVREKARDRARRCLVVVLTDGRATGGPDPLGRTRAAAARLVAEGATAVVVDCETSWVRLGLAEELATALRAPAVRLAHLRADDLTRVVTRTEHRAA
ncbi:magnesium chelatase subunit D family protein [Mycolicibacterium sp. S2-37]|uniref:magnesium chelatase subunit D family protein n=1 Tax=Mycolicibacterium sp. S2-37 TaxID=2810297 RepID=UPI001A943669|nr:magnesium chelatase subunit D family protein [Mycolicibacterium sp. S2-37]MBO0677096.1 magnesium chelatase subunit D family protein [Mycolicibacterium sp. S2-37]